MAAPNPAMRAQVAKLTVPIDLPAFALNRTTVRAFNALYFHKQIKKRVATTVDYEPFFYPLDSVQHWNRMYGKEGLLQFQCVVPPTDGLSAIREMLSVIAESGLASFLAVLKIFGDVQSPGMMSFPTPGITLALDFPIRSNRSFSLVDQLGELTLAAKGRIYPAKDARMTPSQFQHFYPAVPRLLPLHRSEIFVELLEKSDRTMSKVEGPLNILVLGATSAIAQATTRIYAARHASFYLVARNPEKLSAIAADAQVRGASKVHTQAFDLDDIGRHPALLAEVRQQFAHIDIALLAHGVLGDQAEAERDFAVTEAILRTNFLSVVSLATHLANEFERQKKGTIAVISSVAGDRGRKSNYVYGTSKAALTVFLQGLRNRLDRQGVQVLTIKPGFVATPMTAHLKQGPALRQPAQDCQRYRGGHRAP